MATKEVGGAAAVWPPREDDELVWVALGAAFPAKDKQWAEEAALVGAQFKKRNKNVFNFLVGLQSHFIIYQV